ncbi:MAG: hypothetical protein ACPG4Y_10580 [Chitinophagales bacterium]
MLRSDIATALRGGNINFEIFSLSFMEYLNFQIIKPNTHGSDQKSLVLTHLQTIKNLLFIHI